MIPYRRILPPLALLVFVAVGFGLYLLPDGQQRFVWPFLHGAPDLPAVHFLTCDPTVLDSWPGFTPDGSQVFFSRDQAMANFWDLHVTPVHGGTVQRLLPVTAPVAVTRAAWYGGHGRIAFTAVSGDEGRIWTVGAADADFREYMPGMDYSRLFYPSWYPDGSIVAVDTSRRQLLRLDAASNTVTPLTDPQNFYAGMARVAPDGSVLVVSGQLNTGLPFSQARNSLWLMDADGKLQPLEKSNSANGRMPAWSPDGEWLAFVSTRAGGDKETALFMIRPDGTALRQLTDPQLFASYPAWSPDGKQLVFTARYTAGPAPQGIAVLSVDATTPPATSQSGCR